MLRRPKPEAPYLMKPRRIEDVEKRAEKKKKRRQNVKKGSKSPINSLLERTVAHQHGSEAFRARLPGI